MSEYSLGFTVSWYGDECVIDIIRDISTVSILDIIKSITYRDIRIITVLYHGVVITDYNCQYDCFYFINSNIQERMWNYELRELYKRYKTIEPKNCSSC